jgi:hypothetical protein
MTPDLVLQGQFAGGEINLRTQVEFDGHGIGPHLGMDVEHHHGGLHLILLAQDDL